jgi:hypothetical protein
MGGSSRAVELLSHRMVREDEGESFEVVVVEGDAENVSGDELSGADTVGCEFGKIFDTPECRISFEMSQPTV